MNIENSRESTDKQNLKRKGFSKTSRYKVNIQKLFAFLHNSNKQKVMFAEETVLGICQPLQTCSLPCLPVPHGLARTGSLVLWLLVSVSDSTSQDHKGKRMGIMTPPHSPCGVVPGCLCALTEGHDSHGRILSTQLFMSLGFGKLPPSPICPQVQEWQWFHKVIGPWALYNPWCCPEALFT